MAEEIAFNAKVERPGVCNAMETLLVHAEVAPSFLPRMVRRLARGRRRGAGLPEDAGPGPGSGAATEEDWDTEYLDLILSVRSSAPSKKPWPTSRDTAPAWPRPS